MVISTALPRHSGGGFLFDINKQKCYIPDQILLFFVGKNMQKIKVLIGVTGSAYEALKIRLAPYGPHLAIFVLAFTTFVTGLTGIVYEYTLSTVATYILGNSIEQFSITIGVMLLMMGVAGWIQQYITQRILIIQFMMVEILLALVGGFAPIVMYASFGFMETHFALVQYFFAMLIGFLIGFELPLAIRIGRNFLDSLPKNLAIGFSFDFLGAFVGAIMFNRVLLKNFPLTEMSFLIAATNIMVASLIFLCFVQEKGLKKFVGYSLPILAVMALLSYGYTHNRQWNVELEQRLYKDKVVYAKTSPYQRIVLTKNSDRNEHRLFLNGNLQFSSLDERRYHEFLIHVPMLFVPEDKKVKVLILGGGDGLGLRDLLKYPNIESVTLVDLDPQMVRFAATHPVMAKLNEGSFASAKVKVLDSGAVSEGQKEPLVIEGPRPLRAKRVTPPAMKVADISVINLDADKFLREIDDMYDVIIVDFPDPRSIELSKLYSKEFYLKLRRVLAPDGIAAVQSTSVYYSKEPFLMIGRTMASAGFTVLPYHHEVPVFGDWGYHLLRKDGMSIDAMKERLKAAKPIPFGIETHHLTPELVANSVNFGRNMLVSSEPKEINTLMEPKLLALYLKSWVVD